MSKFLKNMEEAKSKEEEVPQKEDKNIKEKEENTKKETDVFSKNLFSGNKESPKEVKKQEKEEIIETDEPEFSFKNHPILVLLWGYEGTSKSEQIFKFEPKENTIIFDLEDKLRPLAAKLKFPQANIINAKKYNKKYDVSGPETLQGIRDIIDQIKKDKQTETGKFKDVKTIALDGISDIRSPYAIEEWLSEHSGRQKPATWGDWGEINEKVKQICFSLINMGLVTKTNIIFTAQISWDDQEGTDTKKAVADCKQWIWFNIQHKFKMIRDDENHRFYAYCEKSHFDPFFTIDLTDFTHKEKMSLVNMLQDPEILEENIKRSKEEQAELTKKKLKDTVFG